MPPLDSCAYPAAETHLSSPLWLVGAVRREGEREGEREREPHTLHTVTQCAHHALYVYMYMSTYMYCTCTHQCRKLAVAKSPRRPVNAL